MAHFHNYQRWFITLLSLFFSFISGTAANYLCITATQPYSSVSYSNRGGNSPDVQYSTDGGETWKELSPDERVELSEVGDKVYLRGNNPDGFSHESLDPRFIDPDRKYTVFLIGGEVAASGSVMSLIDGEGVTTTIPCEHCFAHLFHGASLTSAPELPATTLKDYCYNNMFTYCMRLTQAPKLPATTLAKGCYTQMFFACENLTQAPELPATTLAKNCYEGMFFNCFALTQAPELPATTLADSCYSEMFKRSGVTQAPVLPATTLAPYCYNLMFTECGNLTQAPELPALELEPYCYKSIFYNCVNLAQAPELPATTLSEGCYYGMFQRCLSLTEAPKLPATTLVKNCYYEMFMYCEQLSYIEVGVNSLDNTVDATIRWVNHVDGPGIIKFPCGSKYDKHGESEAPAKFIIVGSPITIFQNPDSTILYRDTIDCGATPNYVGDTPSAGEGSVFLGWDHPLEALPDPEVYYFTAQYENMGRKPSSDCLLFTAEENNVSFTIENVGGNNPNLEYTTNGGVTWIPLVEGEMVTLKNAGDKVHLRGYNPGGLSHQENVHTKFKMTGAIAASGSVMSLIDGDSSSTEIPNAYCFTRLFLNSTLTHAPSLPATSLKESCYDHMFAGSEILHRIPELPASELEPYCYSYMFAGCNALDSVKSFTATKLAPFCCVSMFTNCTRLKGLPYRLPAMTMEKACYASMFLGCTSLENAPELPAETLAPACYMSMFYGCSSLLGIGLLPANTMEEGCYSSMFENCTSLSQESKMVIDELADGCFESMYKGCTSLTYAPILSAGQLKKECYKEMFSGCTSLRYIEVNVMTLDNDFDATLNWVEGVDGLGLFVFPCGSKYDRHGISEVPDKFTIKSSPVLVFLNYDNMEIWRDTVDCESVPVYKGPIPTHEDDMVFIGWDRELTTPTYADTFYYIAQYEPSGEVKLGPWLCFTAEEAGSEIWYTNHGENHPDVQFSVDGGKTWEELTPGQHIILGEVDQKVYLKGENPNGFSHSSTDNTSFGMSGRITTSGNLMSLIGGDEVPSEIPCAHCFDSLFAGCASLSLAPKLPATTLTEYCYKNMFAHCTGLKKTPELPVQQLAEGCYAYMFQGCTSLVLVTGLPANTLKDRCYYGMFAGCTQLKNAPLLVADQLVGQCYAHMFENCSSLEYIGVEIMSLDNDVDATDKWVDGVDGPGLFVFPCGTKYDKHGISEVPDKFTIRGHIIVVFRDQDSTELWRDTIDCHTIPEYKGATPTIDEEDMVFWKWDKKLTVIDDPGVYYYTAQYRNKTISAEDNYLCFTAEIANSSVSYSNDSQKSVDMQYSLDGGVTWEAWNPRYVIDLNVGEKVYVKGYNPEGLGMGTTRFNTNGRIAASGSIMSLIDAKGVTTVIPCPNCFANLFYNCLSLTQAPELPATTLTEKCYANMFAYSNIREIPELPATELADGCYFSMFNYCCNAETAPDLAATKLAPNCCISMFSHCSGLKNPPALPATKLEEFCYCDMFSYCSALKVAPDLPATQLDSFCYTNMFAGCTDLIQAPELPATELANSCYTTMFSGCTSLTRTPDLPATTLAESCYASMFAGCSALSEAPETLPATQLESGCYSAMFAGCSLTRAPELPATEFKPRCYAYMFNYSRSLNYIKVGVMTLDNAIEATTGWVDGILGEGLFIFPCGSTYDKHGPSEVPTNFTIQASPIVIFQNPDSTVLWQDTIDCDIIPEYLGEEPTYGEGLVFKGWDPELTIITDRDVHYYTAIYEEEKKFDPDKCLCFTAEEANSQLWYKSLSLSNDHPDVQYSTDNGMTWKQLAPEEKVLLSNVGDKVYLRGNNPEGFTYWDDQLVKESMNQFVMTGAIAASGSVMSLIDGVGESTVIPNKKCFYCLFVNCESLTQAPELPATVLTDSCYFRMFERCSSLREAPKLPATTMATSCYDGMFNNCTSLTRAPKLPATTLAEFCYFSMFTGCTGITQAPELPAKKLEPYCYMDMLSHTGITKSCELPATTMAEGCYGNMFSGCDKLKEAPDLPATKLADRCYEQMFYGCTGLTKAPELPASELQWGCYGNMFQKCSNLNYIKVGVMSLDAEFEWGGATENWVSGVDGPGTFIFPCGSTYDKHGDSEVPTLFSIISSPIVIFQDQDNTELWRDTIDCRTVPHYEGKEPSIGDGYVFAGWDKELTVLPIPDVYYFTAQYKKIEPYSVQDSTILACDSFLLDGKKLTTNTTWTDTLTGERLVINYHLLLSHPTERDSSISAHESFTYKGVTYTENAEWSDTLLSTFGCDSIVNYHLVIDGTSPTPVAHKDTSACDVFVFKGITYRENNEWSDTLQTASGGDSIIVYHLTIHKSATVDSTIVAEESFTWKGTVFTENASWSDTLQTIYGCDSIVTYYLEIQSIENTPIVIDEDLSACDSFLFKGITYRENSEWSDTLQTASGGDSIIVYHLTLHKGVTVDSTIIAEESFTWKGSTYTEDASWNDTLQTVNGCDSIVRYNLVVNKEKNLQLTVEDKLYLVLPGGSETISYELTGGEGSKFEVRHNDQTICSGDVTNDSTVNLTCPASLEPGAYTATMTMYDDEGEKAEKEFTFNVMLPDNKQKSYYVKVWNDVVICRNGDGQFLTFQWYKGRKKCENASQQYFNDLTLLDGEYMVYVNDKAGKSYFIEPITYEPVEAAYAITAEPNVVAKNTNFTVKVTGVAPDDLENARIVVYRADGVVEKILDEVKEESEMHLKAGEYVIVLTVNDGKNANCKVLVK